MLLNSLSYHRPDLSVQYFYMFKVYTVEFNKTYCMKES
uniref:Uncharacterized protein n=1 Tax=uncultured Desulfobacterium sp. TaxID=201089 RepID=E1Y9T9_9BACT|nr:unknown protein [uncultured Desulfobacterium sp.]